MNNHSNITVVRQKEIMNSSISKTEKMMADQHFAKNRPPFPYPITSRETADPSKESTTSDDPSKESATSDDPSKES